MPRCTTRAGDPCTQVVLSGLIAAVLAFHLNHSTLQIRHHADSVVPALMGTMKWSPFYWGQNRYGALLPLLALPIENPAGNLLFQQFVNEFCGIAVFFLFPWWLGFRRTTLAAGAISAAMFFACLDARLLTEYLSIAQPYAASLFLLLAGMIALDSRSAQHRPAWTRALRLSLGSLLLTVCFWVNLGMVPLAAALYALRLACERSFRRRGFRTGAILLLSLVVNLLAAQAYPIRSPGSFGTQLAHAGGHFQKILQGIVSGLEVAPVCVLVAVLVGGILVVFVKRRRSLGARLASASLVPACAALGHLCFLAASTWVALNLCHPRYAVPALAAAVIPPGLWAANGMRLLVRRRPARDLATVGVVLLLFATVVFVFRPMSDADRNAHWDERFGRYTRAITTSKLAVVYGDFRDVWPAVFHVNTQRQRRGDTNLLYGLTDRSEDTRGRWFPLLVAGAPVGRLTDSRWPAEPMNGGFKRQEAMAAPLVFVETGRLDSVVLGRFAETASARP